MDSRLLDTLRNAPSLDLYELNLMVNQLLADPVRILEIRKHLHLGAAVMFFDHRTNALAPGRIVELRQKEVCVQEDGLHNRQWILPYAAIVVESAARTARPAPPPQAPVSTTTFNVGDTVTFTDKYFRERVGTVTRLNDKTVSVLCDGERWRVTRRILRKIIDV
jgi:hypothetical protein